MAPRRPRGVTSVGVPVVRFVELLELMFSDGPNHKSTKYNKRDRKQFDVTVDDEQDS